MIVIEDTPVFVRSVVCGATGLVPGEEDPEDPADEVPGEAACEEDPPPPKKNIAAIARTATTPITAAMGSQGWSIKEAFFLRLISFLQNIC
jgi:hypothetical protein